MTELDYIAHQIPVEEFVALVVLLALIAVDGLPPPIGHWSLDIGHSAQPQGGAA